MASSLHMALLRIALLIASIPMSIIVGGTGLAALVQNELSVFLPVLIVGVLVLGVSVLVAAGMLVGLAIVSPWLDWRTQTRSPMSKPIPAASDSPRKLLSFDSPRKLLSSSLPFRFDESVTLTKIEWFTDELPPTLYVDDYTVMQEVSDLMSLREGDHCMVGVNLMHKASSMIDAFVSRVTSWEAAPLRVFHHFILLDSVAQVSPEEGPLRADGKPVRLAEFSETLPGAAARVCKDGYHPRCLLTNLMALLSSSARYHLAPLSDYLPPRVRHGRRGNGILLVQQNLSAEQRRKVCDTALELLDTPQMPAYDIWTANCEHACFVASAHGRWVSPQVSHLSWCLYRLMLQCLGIPCLAGLSCAQTSNAAASVWDGLLTTLFHVFSTFVVIAAVQVQLVRTAVNLTQRRSVIGHKAFHFLMVKETLRAIIVGGLSAFSLGMMPRLVWDTRYLRLACILSLSAHGLCSMIFNISHQLVVRALLRAGLGVPVLLFEDLRDVKSSGGHANSCNEAGAKGNSSAAVPQCVLDAQDAHSSTFPMKGRTLFQDESESAEQVTEVAETMDSSCSKLQARHRHNVRGGS